MAKPVKDKYIAAKVDGDLRAKVDAYIETAKITMGDLVRVAVAEYIKNHPAEKEAA